MALKISFHPLSDFDKIGVRLRFSVDDREALEYVRAKLLGALEGVNVNDVPISGKVVIGYGWTLGYGTNEIYGFEVQINEQVLEVAKMISDIVVEKAKKLYFEYQEFKSKFKDLFPSGEIEIQDDEQ